MFGYVGALGAAGLALAANYARKELGRRYPAEGEKSLHGEIEVNGRKRVVVGYFGASQEVFDKGVCLNRPFWVGSKALAQSYAVQDATRSGTAPVVAVLVADRSPTQSGDYDVVEADSHVPLSARYLREACAKLIRHQIVTVANRQGFIGDVQRWLKAKGRR
ncbi:MAG: hypothetical protein S4CHLAM2_01030 [Chlamydiales bacterium]|nr:hypothetical protein [Chlamydiales bacterium]